MLDIADRQLRQLHYSEPKAAWSVIRPVAIGHAEEGEKMAKGKTVTKSASQRKAGAGAATAARSKDTAKQSAPKSSRKPAAAKTHSAASSRTAAKTPSLAGKVLRKVKATASGAVDLAGSLIGRDSTEKSR